VPSVLGCVSLRPYPSYKPSGVPWLGDVPAGWDVLPGRACYREKCTPNTGMLEKTVLSLSFGRIVVKPPEKLHGLVPASFETYQIVEPGDIVCRPTDLQNDWNSLRFGLASTKGIITSAYMNLNTRSSLVPQYCYSLLHTYDLLKVFYGLGSGLRQNLDWGDFKYLPCLVPSPPDQSAIVRFLGYFDRRIRKYIRAKQKLIGLLTEQKQAIIHKAVTRGLDPNVKLKPSGVPWLGDAPSHWRRTRLKFVASEIVDCLHATPVYTEGGAYPAIRTADVVPGQLLLDRARRVDERHYNEWTLRMAPMEGDVLYTREGERFGIAAPVPAAVRLCISQRMMAFRINQEYNSGYVMWQINCQHVYAQAAGDLIGAAAPHVNVERIKNFWLMIPPRHEQDAIVSAVDADIEKPAAAIVRARDQIRLLREYRSRLIADVVTGKLNVREAAANLPEESEEAEESEVSEDEDAHVEADDLEAPVEAEA
jgi:type I restriction enzyme, S subunit